MTPSAVIPYVVFDGLAVGSAILAVIALASTPAKQQWYLTAATRALVAAWLLVVINRFRWIASWDDVAGLWRHVRAFDWTVSSVFVAFGGAAGVALAWRKRDVAGHVLLSLVAINCLAWDLFAVRATAMLLSEVPERGARVLLNPQIPLFMLCIITGGLAGSRLVQRVDPLQQVATQPMGGGVGMAGCAGARRTRAVFRAIGVLLVALLLTAVLLLAEAVCLLRYSGVAQAAIEAEHAAVSQAVAMTDAEVEAHLRFDRLHHVLGQPIVGLLVGVFVGLLSRRRSWLIAAIALAPVAYFSWETAGLQPALSLLAPIPVVNAAAAAWLVAWLRGRPTNTEAASRPART